MRPTTRTTPDDWARQNRIYPPSADRPGPRDPSLTPYVIPFERAFDDPRYDTGVLVCGSQMGKSEAVMDLLGWRYDQRPVPAIYVGPSQDFMRDEIEPRIQRLIDQAPSLTRKVSRGKKSTKWRKAIGGVSLRLIWSGSASQMSGTTAGLAVVDELDRMAANVKGEGDPLSLVRARGFTYRDRKYAVTSTPLIGTVDIEKDEASGLEFWKRMAAEDLQSPIWRLFQTGTMYHFTLPCPHCGDHFVPRFRLLKWREGATPAEAREHSWLECPRCNYEIEERHRLEMIARGVYVAPGQTVTPDGEVQGDPPHATAATFWVSGLCSPFVTWGERAAAFLQAKENGSQEELQTVINTGMGELWAPGAGDVPEWHEVASLRQDYAKGDLPAGVRLLTLTADVQGNRLVYTIRGWGAKASSWLVDWGELWGPTVEDDVWEQLAGIIDAGVGGMPIRRALIDSGFRPGKKELVPVNKVYAFCRRYRGRVWPAKGRLGGDKPVSVSMQDVTQKGDIKKYGLDLVVIDTDYSKRWVHERVRWPSDKAGAWLLPEDIDDDYCKQIVSEARVLKPSGAVQWVPRSRNNHFLDCEAMQFAVGHMLSVHLIRPAASDVPPAADDAAPSPAPTPAAAPAQPKPVRAPAPARPKSPLPGVDRGAAIARLFR